MLTNLSKSALLAKCEELGFTKCKSKNKDELINLINGKIPKKTTSQIEFIIEEDNTEIYNNNLDIKNDVIIPSSTNFEPY